MTLDRWKCTSYCLCKPSTTRGHFEKSSDEGAWVLYQDAQALERANERLRAGLLGHACFCGSSDLDPAVHREDCAYRKWASPEHPRAD